MDDRDLMIHTIITTLEYRGEDNWLTGRERDFIRDLHEQGVPADTIIGVILGRRQTRGILE